MNNKMTANVICNAHLFNCICPSSAKEVADLRTELKERTKIKVEDLEKNT